MSQVAWVGPKTVPGKLCTFTQRRSRGPPALRGIAMIQVCGAQAIERKCFPLSLFLQRRTDQGLQLAVQVDRLEVEAVGVQPQAGRCV